MVSGLQHADAMKSPVLQECGYIIRFCLRPVVRYAGKEASRGTEREQCEQVLDLLLGHQRQAEDC